MKLGNKDICGEKNKIIYSTFHKTTSKWIKELNMKNWNTKIPQRKHKQHPTLHSWKDFLNRVTFAQELWWHCELNLLLKRIKISLPVTQPYYSSAHAQRTWHPTQKILFSAVLFTMTRKWRKSKCFSTFSWLWKYGVYMLWNTIHL